MVWYCIGKIWYRAAPSHRGNDNAESWCCCCCCGLGLSATAAAAAAAADSGVVVVAILPYELLASHLFSNLFPILIILSKILSVHE